MQVAAHDPGDGALAVDFLSEEFAGTAIICYFQRPQDVEFTALVTEELRFRRAWTPGAAHVVAEA